jgi:glycerophosphoryl diester phosphodiesterase
LLVACRGASALAPENTMAAFHRAAEDGADVVELDVRLSSDGHVVVIHDWHLWRTSNGRGAVARKTLAELKALDAGSWFSPRFAGEPIPTLAEVLTWAQGREPPMPLMVELKGGSRYLKHGLVEKSVQLITEHEMADEVILISSHYSYLSRARAIAPVIATGAIVKLNWFDRLLLPRLLRRWPNLEQAGPVRRRLLRPLEVSYTLNTDSISIPATALTAPLLEAAHAAGLAVNPGGERWDYPAVIALGADTISADDPAAVRAAYLSPQRRISYNA